MGEDTQIYTILPWGTTSMPRIDSENARGWKISDEGALQDKAFFGFPRKSQRKELGKLQDLGRI